MSRKNEGGWERTASSTGGKIETARRSSTEQKFSFFAMALTAYCLMRLSALLIGGSFWFKNKEEEEGDIIVFSPGQPPEMPKKPLIGARYITLDDGTIIVGGQSHEELAKNVTDRNRITGSGVISLPSGKILISPSTQGCSFPTKRSLPEVLKAMEEIFGDIVQIV